MGKLLVLFNIVEVLVKGRKIWAINLHGLKFLAQDKNYGPFGMLLGAHVFKAENGLSTLHLHEDYITA